MHQDGFRNFLELGPSKVVAGLIKKSVPDANTSFVGEPQAILSLPSMGCENQSASVG